MPALTNLQEARWDAPDGLIMLAQDTGHLTAKNTVVWYITENNLQVGFMIDGSITM
jgi:hypothetical protein